MPISRKALCVAYGLIALLALVGTWGNNVEYLSLGFVGANTAFWQATLVNPASRSISHCRRKFDTDGTKTSTSASITNRMVSRSSLADSPGT